MTCCRFGAEETGPNRIHIAMEARRASAHDALDIEGARIRKRVRITLGLNGITKGYDVDGRAGTLGGTGIRDALVGIDGEMPAIEPRPSGVA